MGVHPMFDELRGETRFLALLERTGLAGTTPTIRVEAGARPATVAPRS